MTSGGPAALGYDGRLVGIPFNQIHLVGTEFDLIAEAIGSTGLAGNGRFSKRCTDHLEEELGAPRVLLTHSCTGALEMAAILADVGPGDEVVMPSFTFPSTANAFVLRGATPVFVDIREDTLNLDESLIEAAITDRTKAIAPVHYAGVPCDMDAIAEIAGDAGVVVLPDAAQAIGSQWRGTPAAALGKASALSFHETKNVICGEGGALILNDDDWIERAEILHEKGTNRAAFFRGQVDKYTWVDIGSSFAASDLTAAFLWAQLENEPQITAARVEIWDRYHEAFAELEEAGFARRPRIPSDVVHNGHLYYLLLPDLAERDRLLAHLRAAEIGGVFHYVPLHSSPAGLRYGRSIGDMDVTDRASDRLVRLPMWVGMTTDQVDEVIDGVVGALAAAGRAGS